MKIVLRLFCFLLITFLSLPALSAEMEEQTLQRLQSLSGRIETLDSDFVQTKYLAVFQDAMVSKGRFYFQQPDALRWELTHPVATGFVLQGNKGRRWHQRTGREERFDISREPVMKIVADQLFAWARADFDWLQKEYRITVEAEEPARLHLAPKFNAAGFLDHLKIVFSAGGAHVQMVEVHEKDGDYTRICFEKTVVNGVLPEDVF